jgi:hypothetical protein
MTRHGHRVTRPAGPEALGGAEQPHPGGHRRRSRNRSCPSHPRPDRGAADSTATAFPGCRRRRWRGCFGRPVPSVYKA